MHNQSMNSKIKVAIVGGKGYSGLELARLLKKHPSVELSALFGTKAEGSENGIPYFSVDTLSEKVSQFDTVFLATPPEVSIDLAPKILSAGVKVIDLSGAFRLASDSVEADYSTWYKLNHAQVQFVKEAHFGLVPWSKPSSTTNLVSNPGCYATAVLMGLLPLLKCDLIDPETLVIDAKSGTSGAGKKAEEGLLFTEVDGECLPYKVGQHQHLPEICLYANKYTNSVINPFFTTHLLSVRRGIIAAVYAKLKSGKTVKDVESAMQEFYGHYPLVKTSPGTAKDLMSLKKVVGTANTHITYTVEGNKLYLFSSLDNLLKGAASQAIENFNLIHDLPVVTGLEHLEAMI